MDPERFYPVKVGVVTAVFMDLCDVLLRYVVMSHFLRRFVNYTNFEILVKCSL